MVIVLSAITLVSGFALGGLNELTFETISNNTLRFKKVPAVASIYEGIAGPLDQSKRTAFETDLLAEKQFMDLGEAQPVLVFVIKKDGAPYAVAFERFGQGFGGDLGVMIGYRIEDGSMVGIGITTLSETPGVGSRVTESVFLSQFKSMAQNAILKVKKDGGDIDAIAGATISSRAVVSALSQAKEFYDTHHEQISIALTR
jgi:electron transport complex protein RnfG